MSKYKLGEVCEFINGGAWSDKEYVFSGIPVLKVSNCKNSGFVLDELDYLPEESREKYSKNELKKDDVIIATVGSHPNLKESAAGRSCVVNDSVAGFFLNQNAVCIRSINTSIVDQKYLGYLASSFPFQHYIQMRGRGAANQMRIAIGSIKEYEHSFPDIKKQRRITSILSSYDALIENNQKQIKLLEEAAQRLYKEWFIDLRFPGYETTPVHDGVPDGWERKAFSAVFSYVRGRSYSSKELSDDGILMANLKNIRAFGGYNRGAEKRYIGDYKESQLLSAGDIIMGVTDMTQERRLVGHVAVVPDVKEPMIFSMDLIKLIPITCPKSYLYSALQFGGLSGRISPLANGVNVLHLKPEAMMNLNMVVPDETTMLKYDEAFSAYQSRIEILQNQSAVAEEARDRLLPKLMSEEIEV